MGYNEGFQTGFATAPNPFGAVIKRVDEARARKSADDKDLRDLRLMMVQLGMKHEYEQSLEEQKSKKEKLTEAFKAITSGEIEVPDDVADRFLNEFGLKSSEQVQPQAQLPKTPNLQQEGDLPITPTQPRERLTEAMGMKSKSLGTGGIKLRESGFDELLKNPPPGSKVTINEKGEKSYSIPLNRELTEGESRSTSAAESVKTTAKSLIEVISKNKDKGKEGVQFKALFPFESGNEEAQQYKFDLDYLNQQLVYLRSGAQINENEYKRFRSLMPKFGRFDNVDIHGLEKLMNEFGAIQDRIEQGARWDKNKKVFVNSDNTPYKQESQQSGNKIGRFIVETE